MTLNGVIGFIRPDSMSESLKSSIHGLSFLSLFYHYTTLSSRAVDDHQMYPGGLVVKLQQLVQRSRPPLP